jgi:two-component system, chemotaxis family, CheB/CheR fusion protein
MQKNGHIKNHRETSGISEPERKISTPVDFPIVGIGASAGGLEALEEFLTSLPAEFGMALVVIQHLDPTHVGVMPQLLQRNTRLQVIQATDDMLVEPDHVYVIPPNKSMSILNGYLHLFEPLESRGLRLPIDIFFRSLADDRKEKSIGIILSGMGSDGSLGLKAIKEQNGIVLVQDPGSSKFNGMPLSAIDAVNADIIAPANELPLKLISLLRYTPLLPKNFTTDDKNKTNLEKIIILLRSQTGHDFSLYKKSTIYRRIERRMSVHQLGNISAYVRLLQENTQEIEILFKELLISVTCFFRDRDLWKKLRETILPKFLKTVAHGYVMRVWITGCSTGEEAYSFAIIFRELLENSKLDKNITLQIFATDLDKDAIEIARKGIFSSNISADVSPERLSRFFTFSGTNYIISPSIREMIVFAHHSVIKDPPFSKLDFVFCRNVFIYMEAELQKKIMNMFYYSLNEGGILILGTAENINSRERLFIPADNKLKIYKRTSEVMDIDRLDFPNSGSHTIKRSPEVNIINKKTVSIQSFADQFILQNFAPASVLINPEGDILYITGRTGKYLEPAAGKANMNIYAMAREGLRSELLGAIRKAKESFEPIIIKNIKVGTNGGTQFVDITVKSTEKPDEFRGTIMIVFIDVANPPKVSDRKFKSGKLAASQIENEMELNRTREELQSTREEMQTSQEELKSTNEELQSTNEELQSTNEELTTSKEEMQSLNEELQTVNLELQTKVNEFMDANNDMKNLLNSTDIATLFLDRELNIRRFTDHMTKLIKLRPSDIGRPFTEMRSDLQYANIAEDAKEVLRTLIFKETDVVTKDNRWFTVRIMPYRTLDDRIDGLVITFLNISTAKRLESELKETIRILKEHNIHRP